MTKYVQIVSKKTPRKKQIKFYSNYANCLIRQEWNGMKAQAQNQNL